MGEEETRELVARTIFNASTKAAGRTVLWVHGYEGWPQESTREEARACADAVLEVLGYPALLKCAEALAKLRLTARVLLQNAEGCAINHYGEDFSLHGPPGWLIDSEAEIRNAEEALSLLSQAQNCKPDSTLTDPDDRTALPRREDK